MTESYHGAPIISFGHRGANAVANRRCRVARGNPQAKSVFMTTPCLSGVRMGVAISDPPSEGKLHRRGRRCQPQQSILSRECAVTLITSAGTAPAQLPG